MNLDQLKHETRGTLLEKLGIEFEYLGPGEARASIHIQRFHLAPNGYLHGGSVVSLADSCCGLGCLASLPDGAEAFTTVELKSNFVGTARRGKISCNATLAHGGRTTQVWDAVVFNDEAKKIALFRCTQFVLYPR